MVQRVALIVAKSLTIARLWHNNKDVTVRVHQIDFVLASSVGIIVVGGRAEKRPP